MLVIFAVNLIIASVVCGFHTIQVCALTGLYQDTAGMFSEFMELASELVRYMLTHRVTM